MKTKTNSKLAEFLAEIKKDGVNFSQLAKKAGIPRSTLTAWASGQTPSDFAAIRRLSTVTKKSVHYILYGEEDKTAPSIPDERMLEEYFAGRFEVDLKLRRIIETNKGE